MTVEDAAHQVGGRRLRVEVHGPGAIRNAGRVLAQLVVDQGPAQVADDERRVESQGVCQVGERFLEAPLGQENLGAVIQRGPVPGLAADGIVQIGPGPFEVPRAR